MIPPCVFVTATFGSTNMVPDGVENSHKRIHPTMSGVAVFKVKFIVDAVTGAAKIAALLTQLLKKPVNPPLETSVIPGSATAQFHAPNTPYAWQNATMVFPGVQPVRVTVPPADAIVIAVPG